MRMLILMANILAATLLSSQDPGVQIKHNSDRPLDGRLLLIVSTNDKAEPRFQISDDYTSQQIFGKDVEGWTAAFAQSFEPTSYHGYPLDHFEKLSTGWYFVQAVLNQYEYFDLSTGHTVLLPPDKGEGQQWNLKPGNLYSTPQKVYIDPANPQTIEILLDQTIPEIAPPKDTEYIKHIQMKSELLSAFWGRDIYLGAHILLPHNFEKDKDFHYPLMVFQGHFPRDFGGFQTTPPSADMDTSEYSQRFKIYGYKKMEQQEAYDFYKKWTSDDFPRFIVIEIQHPTPYYDDSYAVNSASQGPYGDALTYELIPYIEKQYRGIGEGWARFLYGGSTGGWEALAVQTFYPDEYNACFAACPDPIDFRAYTTVNIYEDENAYEMKGDFGSVDRPGKRDYLGHISTTLRQTNQYELALGSKSRSGQQWDIWEATYSPMGPDGYPQRLWNKETGVIDKKVADYWRDNYDLGHILKRDWATLGPKMEGKIHIYCGDMDNYYLNNAVYLVEDMLKKTSNPFYGGEVTYGDRAEHCWNGDPNLPNHVTRLRYNTMYLPKMLDRIAKTAPKNADLRWWKR